MLVTITAELLTILETLFVLLTKHILAFEILFKAL